MRRGASRRWFRIFTVGILAGSTLLAAGCGSGDSSSSTSGGGQPTLKIAIGSNALNYAAFWFADAENLFAKHGVNVDVVNANALSVAPALLTSGQIDLLLSSPGQSVAVAAAGKDVKLVFGMYNYSPRGGAFVGSTKVTSMKQLQSMGPHCTIVTTPAATASFAMANQIQRAYGLHCKLLQQQTNPLQVAALTAGRGDAGTFTPADAQTVVARGGHLLLNPSTMSDADVKKIVPKPFTTLDVTGLTPTLKKKSDAVERFLAAMKEGLSGVTSSTPAQLAAILAKEPYFKGITQAQMVAALSPAMSAFPAGGTAGQITEDDWSTLLRALQEDFGLPGFDKTNPRFAYAQMVDMRYLTGSKSN